MQVIVLCMAEKWLTMLFPACILLVYVVQKVYLRSSRQLRYLELEARASVFSSFLESVSENIVTGTNLLISFVARLKALKRFALLTGPELLLSAIFAV